ncbi:hypothetical protein VZT92_017371 [Zoarces viviparus]|uniref:Uncharacterized protein n=1 Tax=Zoarces viviparus TaxID=48416 RepID=A0AAW1ERX9_ZOAVI
MFRGHEVPLRCVKEELNKLVFVGASQPRARGRWSAVFIRGVLIVAQYMWKPRCREDHRFIPGVNAQRAA